MRIQQTVRYIHPFPLLPQAGNYVTTTVWVGLVGFSISSASPTESDRSCISSRPPGQTRPWKYRDAWGDSFFCFRLDESGAASGWLTGRPLIIPHSGRGGRKLHKKALQHFAGKVSSLHPKKVHTYHAHACPDTRGRWRRKKKPRQKLRRLMEKRKKIY